ncbi:MAG: hypothetical protein JXB46_11580 [Candidatus Eisenbacteria bacterium]|nr:hypothetical protein [Candidatus Eisenbacteria bacterium]
MAVVAEEMLDLEEVLAKRRAREVPGIGKRTSGFTPVTLPASIAAPARATVPPPGSRTEAIPKKAG